MAQRIKTTLTDSSGRWLVIEVEVESRRPPAVIDTVGHSIECDGHGAGDVPGPGPAKARAVIVPMRRRAS